MYNLIFYYIYCNQINKKKGGTLSRYNATIGVFIAMVIHSVLLLEILKKIKLVGFDMPPLVKNRSIEITFFLSCIFLVYFYFTNKKIEKIENRYSESKIFERYGGWITALLIFVPMLIFIIILS
jgi:hypothetical protein